MAKAVNKQADTLTKNQFNILHVQLKEVSNSWAHEVVTYSREHIKSSEDKTLVKFKAIDKKKVYNVFNDVVRDHAWKVFVYKMCLAWMRDKKDEISSLLSQPH